MNQISSQIKFYDQILKITDTFCIKLEPVLPEEKKLRILANPMGLEVKRLFYFFEPKKTDTNLCYILCN